MNGLDGAAPVQRITLPDAVEVAAERLRQAGTLRRPCQPVRHLIGDDVAAALAVQEHVVALRCIGGSEVMGGKVGRRAPDRAGFSARGVLTSDQLVADGAWVATSRLLQPRLEVKLACRLLATPDPRDPAAIGAVVAVAAAIEVTDCRIADWDLTQVDEIADNACAGLFVHSEVVELASAIPSGPFTAVLDVDGTPAWTHTVDALGPALSAVYWLATAVAGSGRPLRGGDVVLSEAIAPSVPVKEGCLYTANVAGLPPVSVGFTTSSLLAQPGALR